MAQLVSSLIIIKFVAPEELGLWQSVRLAQVYAVILLAGTNNGLNRELPYFLGKGDLPFSESLLATALFCTRIVSAIILLSGIGCLLYFSNSGANVLHTILAVTIIISLSFYQTTLGVTFRSKDSFKNLTFVQLVGAGLSVATVPMVYFFHYNGMLVRYVLISCVGFGLMYFFRPMRVKTRFDLGAFKLLLKTGLPIFGLDYLKNSAATLDRVVLLKIGGVQEVGFYSLATTVIGTIQVLPQALSSYTYPRMTFKIGQNVDKRELWGFVLKFALLSAGLAIPAVICGWMALPYFIKVFAPKYLSGLCAAQIALLVGVLDGTVIVADALWSMKAWKLMATYMTLSSVTYALGPVLGCLVVGPSLEGVAWGVVSGAFFRSILALGLTYYGTHRSDNNSNSLEPGPDAKRV
ncbi:MAG: lipopolysaccharide biosynthesis protein [Syntrophobacteraceae bacterium]